MHLSQLQQFLAMGGYAKYVWSAYGLTFLVLLIIVIHTWLNHRQILIQLKLKHITSRHAIKTQLSQQSAAVISNNTHIPSPHLRIE